ncbi:MAG: antitoxin VapB family protein [Thermoplasmatota archaeon]
MGTKSIEIKEETYELLKSLKEGDESFDDVLKRITRGKYVMNFAGTCPGLGKEVEKAKTELKKDLERKNDELFGE